MSNLKSKQELIDHTADMRSRGHQYRTIIAYLKNNAPDEKTTAEVLGELDRMEKSGELRKESPQHKKSSWQNIVFGGVILIIGLIMMSKLWDAGIIAVLPIALIGIGSLAMLGFIKMK
ncbi:hypothetical protein [Halocola ammonii]